MWWNNPTVLHGRDAERTATNGAIGPDLASEPAAWQRRAYRRTFRSSSNVRCCAVAAASWASTRP